MIWEDVQCKCVGRASLEWCEGRKEERVQSASGNTLHSGPCTSVDCSVRRQQLSGCCDAVLSLKQQKQQR